MKIYFFDDKAIIADFLEEPSHLASFELTEGMSKFAPRYALDDSKLVDKFPGKTDDEVISELQAAEVAKAEKLAQELAAK